MKIRDDCFGYVSGSSGSALRCEDVGTVKYISCMDTPARRDHI